MSKRRHIGGRSALVVMTLVCCASPGRAVNIVLDYSYDAIINGGANFFGAGNPSGPAAGTQAKAAIEAVASFYSGILTDTLSAIVEPPDYLGPMGGTAEFHWSIQFDHPGTGAEVSIPSPSIAADEYRIYVGARNIAGTTLGIGGPGGVDHGYGYSAFPSEVPEILQIYDDFVSAITTRGESSGFANWGGAVTFDTSGTVWHYNHTTAPTASSNDFYSVAIHELGHALGLGASDAWFDLASGAFFAGSAAAAEYGSAPPLEPPNPTRGHWKSGTMSQVFGTNTPQEAAMDPEILQGTRKLFTSLDGAALVDIGWSVNEPSSPTYHPADFNQDHFVNGGDLTRWKTWFGPSAMADADGDGDSDGRDFLLWQRAVGTMQVTSNGGGVPEPSAAALMAWGAMLIARRARRRTRFR